ncbi:MAG: RNA polymerase factor sigma-54 [Gammaproteobacteria bacterium]|nr:RNA polymerase factor sigma-54 [Gammaproteobacteria bacterium]
MKQSLTLRLGQQQVITPQLSQAIRMLQLSTQELDLEVQEALESNPMLERDEAAPETGEEEAAKEGEEAASEAPELDLEGSDAIPEDLPIDTRWEDVYAVAPSSAPAPEERDLFERAHPGDSLQDHLLWQLNLAALPPLEHLIATVIIDAIDDSGMVATSAADIASSFDGRFDISEAQVTEVLRRLQHFDPPGVAARNLAEALSLQLQQLDPETPWREEAIDLVEAHLDLLAAKDFATLKRRTQFGEEELAQIAALIGQLNPRPGAAYSAEPTLYVVPEVVVKKINGRWRVELNPDALPRLRINPSYAGLVKRADNSPDNVYLRDNLAEARWFLKCLQSRHDTLLKVATKIVEVQQDFLTHGEEAMKPLVLNDIAEAVEMHESTISRVTSRKYMHTPRGLFELKYFFSSHVSTSSGGEVSSTAIRALIRKLTAAEDPRKPLSDSKIAAILADQNIKVARRTVAKYRESISIPPSNMRKRLA